VDRDRIARLLEEIKRSLRVIETVISQSMDEFLADVRNRYTLRLSVVEIVEAAASIGLHILREQFGEDAEGYVSVFRALIERGVLPSDVGEGMIRLVRLRNLIVHRYWEVNDVRLYKEIKDEGVKLVKRFIEEVERYVSRA